MSSRLIVIEGLDGSGKSTQMELVCDRLKKMGQDFRRISFPCYDSDSSALIKMYLRGDFGADPDAVNPYAASTFFTVDRFASYKSDWGSDYASGRLIISDRYTTSNAIHQAGKLDAEAREEYLSWLFDFEYNTIGLPEPSLVIYLDMPTEYSLKLISKRQGDSGDIHELDHEYLARCRANALDVCRRFGWRKVKCVDETGLRTPHDINDEIMSIINEVLSLEAK